jgi:very-short-patch-repair endonuclease
MPNKSIITGQQVSSDLIALAQELRRNMTPAESILWQSLRANRLGGFHFRRQQIIGTYIVDFYCHSTRLVIEVDGGIHITQQAEDYYRDTFFQDLGLTVFRFKNEEVEQQIDRVLSAIHELCLEGKQRLNQET